jgi:hypothetical protein
MFSWLSFFIFLFIGLFLYVWLKKRKFDQCNQFGVEQFNNYSNKAYTKIINKMILWSYITSFIISFLIVSTIEPNILYTVLIYSIIDDLLNMKTKPK